MRCTTEFRVGYRMKPASRPPCLIAVNHVEHLEHHHLQPTTNGFRCARLDLGGIKYFGLLDDRRHYHITDPMLEEDILCRLSGTALTTTPSLLGLPPRYTIFATLAETPEEEFKASKMKYVPWKASIPTLIVRSVERFTVALWTKSGT